MAFGEGFTEAELENERRCIELDRIVGAFDGERRSACSGAYTFRLTTPGGEVGAAGITLDRRHCRPIAGAGSCA